MAGKPWRAAQWGRAETGNKIVAETKNAKPKSRVTRQNVAATAIECFRRYGLHRTSMNDIADAFGVSRQTLYRLFDSRSALLEYIATQRVELLTRNLAKYLAKYERLPDALVDGMAHSIKLGREDELLAEIVRQEGDEHFTTFLFGGTKEVQAAMLEAWQPLLRRARDEGQLADDVTDIQIIEWLSNVGAFLNTRPDYVEEDHRRILRQFVLPSLRI